MGVADIAELRDVNVFVAPDGNAFMRDIGCWIVEAAELAGRRAALVDDRLPAPDGAVNLVVAPHEFYLLRDDSDTDIRAAARCSIPICTEQPGTPWFPVALGFCVGSPLVLDINAVGLEALVSEGYPARRLHLGGVAQMDRRDVRDAAGQRDSTGHRDVDVVVLAGSTPRRAAALARLGPVLWDRHCELRMFTFSRPVTGDEPGLVFGADKYDLLARSKVLVNLHRVDESDDSDDSGGDAAAGYFEWARMVEAMANGCVVVTEPSLDHDPLVAGEHFVETSLDDLAATVIDVLDDEPRRSAIATAAHDAVMGELALGNEMCRLLDVLDARGLLVDAGRSGTNDAGLADRVRSWWARTWPGRTTIQRTANPPMLPVFAPHRSKRRRLYDQLLAEIAHRRKLDGLRSQLEHGDADHVAIRGTSVWGAAAAEVSVVVTVFDYADVVVETLESIVASTDVSLEIVIIDDHSTDDGLAVVEAWMDDHDDVPALLLASGRNRGLTRARNLAIESTRADKLMIMDADNLVYPTCLRRLADALELDPGGAFAYATLEAFGAHPGLRSAQGWFVPWLCEANYIDAQAMIRRSTFERLDGYRDDDTMYGWEDWDLWLRIAVDGGHGVHVPEMLGRYRTQSGSMHSLTNLAGDDLRAGLVARYPTLPWPELAPLDEREPIEREPIERDA